MGGSMVISRGGWLRGRGRSTKVREDFTRLIRRARLATSREDHRLPRSRREFLRRQLGRGRSRVSRVKGVKGMPVCRTGREEPLARLIVAQASLI
jgi:hypothetical protein